MNTNIIIITLIASCIVEFAVSKEVGAGGILEKFICLFKSECCDDKSIPADFNKLEQDLSERIYGQSIVQEVVPNALRSHWDPMNKPQKALVLSFHGWTGGGKNYVTSFIIENLYSLGYKSNMVHQFFGRIHFTRHTKVAQYQDDLYRWIKGNVTLCAKQIFVFDEVDKMPPKVLDILQPIIDYQDHVEGVDYRQCIFIFLSNTGGDLINEQYLELWQKNGIRRDDMKLEHFENLVEQGAFTKEGGLQYADVIIHKRIDYFIPFLPLEKRHVRRCIVDQFKKRKIYPSPADVNEVMEFFQWGPSGKELFSKTGCHGINQKVGMVAFKNKRKNEL